MIVAATSGGWDPIHIGHVRLLRDSKKLCDKLIVIVHSDQWLINKKGYVFMPYDERKEILESIRYVDEVVPAIDDNPSVYKSLEYYRPNIFTKGGDRIKSQMPIEEIETCKRLDIKIIYNVGGKKVQSSSELIRKVNNGTCLFP